MSDIFISYARTTAAQAHTIAEALRAIGYAVWRDDQLPTHRAYGDVIEERLAEASAVVVVWSEDSAHSQWVRSEADRARSENKLVQVRVGSVRLPMPFDQIQCADLSDWRGEPDHLEWRKAVDSVRELLASGAHERTTASLGPIAQRAPLLAVLAFDNLSGDPALTYFSDGVSEEILDTVARSSGLTVIAPSSSFQFRGPDKAVRRVAAELKVTHLLDGSVRRAGTRVRISAHLVDCASETALWTDRFERELTDVFAVQDEIAEAVAGALKVVLAPVPKPAVIKPETYETYLQALPKVHFTLLYADEAALPMLERVVADAPTFAAAWENLAVARAKLLRSPGAQPIARASAVDAAETALRLDPTRGRAYLALALLEPWAAHAGRETMLDRALAANENDALLMVWRAFHLIMVGRSEAGLEEARRAAALDPLVPYGKTMVSAAMAQLGRYRESLDLWARGPAPTDVESPPRFHAAILGDWSRFDADDAARSGGELLATTPRGEAQLRKFFSNLRTNDRDAMRASLARAQAMVRETGTIPINVLSMLDLYDLRDEAYELVEAASFDHLFRPDGPLPTNLLGPHVIFDVNREGGLPQDPRFLSLCAKLGLCDYWLETDCWPHCADQVPYDFRAEARRAAAAERLSQHA